jgi:hypothetical protein
MVYDNDSAVASKEAAGAPEREIEVTPEMIAAGSETLALFRQSEDSSEVIVEEVFRSMASVSKVSNFLRRKDCL